MSDQEKQDEIINQLFATIKDWEYKNKHSQMYKSKEMEGRIKKLIQNTIVLED